MHQDPAAFPDPLTFDPERGPLSYTSLRPNSLMTFSGGPRGCPGKVRARARACLDCPMRLSRPLDAAVHQAGFRPHSQCVVCAAQGLS